jgi:hypothetical protein
MKSISRVLAGSAIALSLFAPVSAMADDGIAGTAFGGTCNGVADSDCEYCSYEADNYAHAPSLCNRGYAGYYWEFCGAFANGYCYVG